MCCQTCWLSGRTCPLQSDKRQSLDHGLEQHFFIIPEHHKTISSWDATPFRKSFLNFDTCRSHIFFFALHYHEIITMLPTTAEDFTRYFMCQWIYIYANKTRLSNKVTTLTMISHCPFWSIVSTSLFPLHKVWRSNWKNTKRILENEGTQNKHENTTYFSESLGDQAFLWIQPLQKKKTKEINMVICLI